MLSIQTMAELNSSLWHYYHFHFQINILSLKQRSEVEYFLYVGNKKNTLRFFSSSFKAFCLSFFFLHSNLLVTENFYHYKILYFTCLQSKLLNSLPQSCTAAWFHHIWHSCLHYCKTEVIDDFLWNQRARLIPLAHVFDTPGLTRA